ncbi:MAG: carbohydrate ABC transporter permease [Lachnospiraceae bacterium]|jgi:putative aldouronate transport system permease protein|nr:carbohydrate ABC transporter permease [Lachnospiraceae bacterium]
MREKKSRRLRPEKVLIRLFLSVVALVIIIPILNILAKSISDPRRVPFMEGWQFWPEGVDFVNYKLIFSNRLVLRSFANSLFITAAGTALSLLVTGLAAYAMTRPGLPLKRLLMVFFIVMMIFEPSIIQEYFVVKNLGLLNNVWIMVLYNSVNVYYLVLMMRFFEQTPASLIEAAKIDGAGEFTVFLRIFLPLNKIVLMTVGMFYAVVRWNEYFRSSVFLQTRDGTVLQVFLRQFVVEGDSTTLAAYSNVDLTAINVSSLKAATIVIVMVPILAVYPLILKYYTGGVMAGGIKE